MKIGTIYYLIPDIFQAKFNLLEFQRRLRRGTAKAYINSCRTISKKSIGGVKVFYQHCRILNELGYEAYPLALGNYDGNRYYHDMETKSLADVGYELKPNDIVVSTEFSPYDGLKFQHCKRMMFAQNWFWVGSHLKTRDKGKSYRNLGYDYVISCGDYISQTIHMLQDEGCITVSNGIDENVFHSDDSERQENRIMCLPRRNHHDILMIKKMVLSRFPSANFVEVDGVSEAEIAKEFRRSDIFLATGYPEGFSLPPLEALFSGCVVVGFAGRGGRQYLKDGETALISEDGDCVNAAKDLLQLLESPTLKKTLRENSGKILKDYTLDAMKGRVKALYLDIGKQIQ